MILSITLYTFSQHHCFLKVLTNFTIPRVRKNQKGGSYMNYQIRRHIHETSSSSANALVMVSKHGKYTEVKLDKTWICVSGCYNTAADGLNHIFINSWADKMAFLADDTPIWHEMFKKATGQDFVMYSLFHESISKNKIDISSVPGAIYPENRCNGYMQVVPGLEYICGIHVGFYDILIALPDSTSQEFLDKYHLQKTFTAAESLIRLDGLKRLFGEEETDIRLLEEIIFNPAIAFNIGGDGFADDDGFGIINGYRVDTDVDTTFRRAEYSVFDTVYHNGNETLLVGLDGTKVRICPDDVSEPEYPESIDVKITDRCENGCTFCYEGCTPEGLDGAIPDKLFSSIPAFTELAIGGGNALLHPEIFRLRDRYKAHMNITVHGEDFLKACMGECYGDINSFYCSDLTEGEKALLRFDAAGVSVSSGDTAAQLEAYLGARDYPYDGLWFPQLVYTECVLARIKWNSDYGEELKERWKAVSQIVIHVVNGVIAEGMLDPLFDKGLDLLVLGYKNKGRGVEFANSGRVAENQKWLYQNIDSIAKHFRVTAFDNLALEQLDMHRFISDEDWKHFYMGDEGTHSMYIDLVKKEYGISSTDNRRWKLTDDIREMFRLVRSVVSEDKAKHSAST